MRWPACGKKGSNTRSRNIRITSGTFPMISPGPPPPANLFPNSVRLLSRNGSWKTTVTGAHSRLASQSGKDRRQRKEADFRQELGSKVAYAHVCGYVQPGR